jgi:hypothetical protein
MDSCHLHQPEARQMMISRPEALLKSRVRNEIPQEDPEWIY